ncbi:NADP-dependent 3-hydroxy acid dehydrogenase YdfG [Chitinophaga skermanii]|uniref:NADP-dependent 3-hydroxy acid dehydrogenase YdfG n=1 Tax=Chitinophaga skermanii TaxID=331697 RepID=A0A327QYV4_9BACT|nr:SDR family NAD(P)-dependent oxidoreductase [Chitinophaga skermanii]RAJ08802.1 NADP-dependent 3-hydroxy acid dehydrogenase YdfG [Chitinophaga skermanii]
MIQTNYNGALQHPLGSGFSASSTTWDVIQNIQLHNTLAIVTGGNAGIGLETVKTLVSAGAHVIVAARDTEKAKRNLADVPNVEFAALDLMEPASVDAFAAHFLASNRPLHLLINNAGIMWVPLRKNSKGIESQLATNYLGAFQLTARLFPALKAANGARVVNVSSYGHQMADIDFNDLNFEQRDYFTLTGYGQSKTALNLFTVELDRRAQASNVRAYVLHPGSVLGTELGREEPIDLFIQMGTHDTNGVIKPEVAARLKTLDQGAATTVWCATSPLLNHIGGVYCEDADVAELDLGQIEHKFDEPATIRGVQPYSLNENSAKRLWEWSERVLGFQFVSL